MTEHDWQFVLLYAFVLVGCGLVAIAAEWRVRRDDKEQDRLNRIWRRLHQIEKD